MTKELTLEEAKAIAKEAYIYGFPMVINCKTVYDYVVNVNSPDYKGPFNQRSCEARVYTPDDKTVVTPNSDTPYCMLWMDLRAEPQVISVPEMEPERFYHVQLIDWYTHNYAYIGTRTNENKAGKYLLVGPNWKGEKPEGIKEVIKSETNLIFAVIRTQLFNEQDLEKVKEIQDGYDLQTLSAFLGKDAPAASTKIDFPEWVDKSEFSIAAFEYLDFALDQVDTHPDEVEFMEKLANYINDETTRPEDAAMLGMLATLGIEKGKPFKPDARMKKILTEAATVGRAMVKAIAWKPRFPAELLFAYLDRHWKWIFVVEDPTFHTENNLIIDQRTRFGFEAIGTAKAMTTRIVGAGSAYVGAYEDADGNWLEGQYSYKLHLPAGVPANLFWSATVYDNETRSQLDNGTGCPPVRGSVHGAVPNEDGSFDLFFSPECPANVDENNRVWRWNFQILQDSFLQSSTLTSQLMQNDLHEICCYDQDHRSQE